MLLLETLSHVSNFSVLSKALLRPGRLDRIVYVPLPEAETRKQILELQLKKMPICKDLDTNYLVEKTNGYSGAEVSALLSRAQIEYFMYF